MQRTLKVEQARKVLRLYQSGKWSQVDLAKKFGVSQPAISMIINRKTYRDAA